MVKIVNGDLLDCKEEILCHQVNTHGSMGGGVAYQIKQKYPLANAEYEKFCSGKTENELIGQVCSVICKDKTIVNIFSQKGSNTDYDALRQCLTTVADVYKGKAVAMPYKIGCGIAKGNWNTVLRIIEEIFQDAEVTLYKFNG